MRFILFIFIFFLVGDVTRMIHAKRLPRSRPKTVSTKKAKEIALLTPLETIMEDVNKIAIERVPDTPGHKKVEDFILSRFGDEWYVERDVFEDSTPFGIKTFTNIIATPKGDWEIENGIKSGKTNNIILLVAHYDSKFFESPRHFVAATDSAVPCALLLDIATVLNQNIQSTSGKRPLLKIVFLDGEEAFKDWTAQDSIYGARHLANKWQEIQMGNKSVLENIENLILLDLWGGSSPKFYSYHEDTDWLFNRLIEVEKKLKEAKEVTKTYFASQKLFDANLQDDHIPFLERGVSTLHLIPVPFPKVWHTDDDNVKNLDNITIKELSMIFRVFIYEYLSL